MKTLPSFAAPATTPGARNHGRLPCGTRGDGPRAAVGRPRRRLAGASVRLLLVWLACLLVVAPPAGGLSVCFGATHFGLAASSAEPVCPCGDHDDDPAPCRDVTIAASVAVVAEQVGNAACSRREKSDRHVALDRAAPPRDHAEGAFGSEHGAVCPARTIPAVPPRGGAPPRTRVLLAAAPPPAPAWLDARRVVLLLI